MIEQSILQALSGKAPRVADGAAPRSAEETSEKALDFSAIMLSRQEPDGELASAVTNQSGATPEAFALLTDGKLLPEGGILLPESGKTLPVDAMLANEAKMPGHHAVPGLSVPITPTTSLQLTAASPAKAASAPGTAPVQPEARATAKALPDASGQFSPVIATESHRELAQTIRQAGAQLPAADPAADPAPKAGAQDGAKPNAKAAPEALMRPNDFHMAIARAPGSSAMPVRKPQAESPAAPSATTQSVQSAPSSPSAQPAPAAPQAGQNLPAQQALAQQALAAAVTLAATAALPVKSGQTATQPEGASKLAPLGDALNAASKPAPAQPDEPVIAAKTASLAPLGIPGSAAERADKSTRPERGEKSEKGAKTVAVSSQAVTAQSAGNAPLPGLFAAPAPVAATAPAPAVPTASAPAPQAIEALVERLVQARESAQPGSARLSVANSDFGSVTLRFETGLGGLSVSMTNADPEFAATARTALAERAALAGEPIRTEPAQGRSDASGQQASTGQSQTQSHNHSSSHNHAHSQSQAQLQQNGSNGQDRSQAQSGSVRDETPAANPGTANAPSDGSRRAASGLYI